MRIKTQFKFSLMVILLVMLSTYSFAQFTGGAKVGANFSTLGNAAIYTSDRSAIKFNVGGFGEYQLLDFLSLRAELFYTQEGGPLADYYVYQPYVKRSNVNLTVHSVQLPLMVQFSLPSLKDSKINPKVFFGGYYSYSFFYRERYKKTIDIPGLPSSSTDTGLTVSSLYNKFYGGYLFGIGANLKLFGKDLNADIRYARSLSNLNADVNQVPDQLKPLVDSSNKLYMGTISLNFGMKLF